MQNSIIIKVMNNLNYLAFENYLANEMSNDEKIVFENKLKVNDDFNNEFQSYKETTVFLQNKFAQETADFKQNLKSISKSNFSENKGTKSKVISINSKYFAVAASLLMFLGVFYIYQNQTPNYTDFNQHENASFTERGTLIASLKAAQDAFNDKKYQEALPLFENVLKVYNKPEIQYFYAICLIETENYTKAESVLLTLKEGKSIYTNRATWYLALMQLKLKNNEGCKKFLKQIPADAEDYAKAQELLELL